MTPCSSRELAAAPAIDICGATARLCLTGGIYLPGYRTLVISDLHLEKGSAFARHGEHLPPYDTRAGLAQVERARALWQPEQIVFLGDSFHDAAGPERLHDLDRADIARLADAARLIWISGNHDPVIDAALPGARATEISLGPLTLRHAPSETHGTGEIAGHLHPAAAVRRKGRRIRCKCFVHTATRLIMPAFGAFAGGLDVGHTAFRPFLHGKAFHVAMVGRSKIHSLPGHAVAG